MEDALRPTAGSETREFISRVERGREPPYQIDKLLQTLQTKTRALAMMK